MVQLTPEIVEPPGGAILVDHHVLVGLEGSESDRHLGDNACRYSAETLVQGQRRFLLNNPQSNSKERKVSALEREKKHLELEWSLFLDMQMSSCINSTASPQWLTEMASQSRPQSECQAPFVEPPKSSTTSQLSITTQLRLMIPPQLSKPYVNLENPDHSSSFTFSFFAHPDSVLVQEKVVVS